MKNTILTVFFFSFFFLELWHIDSIWILNPHGKKQKQKPSNFMTTKFYINIQTIFVGKTVM